MAIPFSKYVSITSGVGGGNAVARKELILRMFSSNPLIAPNTVYEFTDLDSVNSFFGTSSEEYQRASIYFGFISKNIVKAQKISYYRYIKTDTKPMIWGGQTAKNLGDFSSISDGQFILEIGGIKKTITVDLSGATSLSDVANKIQTSIQTNEEAQFKTATATYNVSRKSFDFVGGVAEDATISVQSSSAGTNITDLLEWNYLAVFANGAVAENLTTCLNKSVNISTNFATLLFVDDLTLAEKQEVASWTQAGNNAYMYCAPTTLNTANTDSAGLIDYGGTGLTIVNDDYADMIPAILTATIDFSKRNSVINFMYNQLDFQPSVTTGTLSNQMDALRVNYYGQTQTAGQNISFYQRGNLMGGATDATAMNTYVNEIWLKDAMGASIMSVLLSLAKVSANSKGRAQILTTCQIVINEALNNGVISVGKTFNNTQKLYIEQITGDDLAYIEIQNKGYWLDAVIAEQVVNGVTEYSVNYTLLYGKDDTVRKVNGTHILI
ncbi:Protein of uncharacterised function (DUF3383) [Campylobacter hyointestinalis subsp. hyointestinalis]|uniref:Protein of uncharacterized function (DUF3383) n=1 Tax=Campylobacter hyointestinalis subsp. hyointestinalis TaxID=91352 RepID=A0A9W5EQY8_CAMHY|nr:DUF3383 domain-containing protein [Campylobacter hyointestinalis]CUU68064.1 Protein of uncharacterised function (DUF3383) [Campylobacter hyointestinalis subsp. hyointestinalis]